MMVEFEPGVRVGLIKFESLAEELEALAGAQGRLGYKTRSEVLGAPRSSRRCPGHLCGMSRLS